MDAVGILGDLIAVLWIALAIAITIFIVASLAVVLRPVGHRIEAWMLPRVTRLARARHGLSPDALPWACQPCHSVNIATAAACYRCGTPRPAAARELREGVTDPGGLHQPAPTNDSEPSLHPGPAAPPPLPFAPAEPRPGRRHE